MGYLKKLFFKLSIESKDLQYKLTVTFGLFFLIPILGFLYFAIKYSILNDEYIPIFFLAVLGSSLFGYMLLRTIFDEIRSASRSIAETLPKDLSGTLRPELSELQGIIQSFQTLETKLHTSFFNFDKKASQILTLKELSDLCYVTFDKDDLFHITMERALKLVTADVGSILLLEGNQRESFVVQATIGLGEILRKGDRIGFKDSIAKFAIVNNSPVLVDDIETDSRFGRTNRSQYGTKSFLCMPIKGISEILGVLTLSRRQSDTPFTQDDIQVLTPLLCNAAFTYDNLLLMHNDRDKTQCIRVTDNIFRAVNSSLTGGELIKVMLDELRSLIAFDVAIIMVLGDPADMVTILDFVASIPITLEKNRSYQYAGSVIDTVIKQEAVLFLSNREGISHPLERELLVDGMLSSGIVSPLKLEGRIIGLLFLGGLKENQFDGQQGKVTQLSQILPVAIEKNRLSTSVAKRDQEMKSIKQIGSMLASSTFDMDQVLNHTMDMIQTLMNVEAGSLLLLEKNELHFKIAFNTQLSVDLLHTLSIKLGHGIAGYSAARGESIIVNHTEESVHFSKNFDNQTSFKTHSALCVPLISQGKVLGVIEVLNKIGGDFLENDLQVLQSIATSVSIALENARLYHETVSMAEEERSIRHLFQKYVPKEVIDKITGDTSERPIFEELKTLTFLNIDIRGFSVLTRDIGPKRTVSLLNHFFHIMGDTVFKHHGIVDKYLGDGFLAIFGAPVSSIADADNAIMSALEMKEAMVKMNDDLAQEFNVTLAMGISIHTGEAVVGNIGFEKKMDYTVIGDSVNVVFRLQDMTKSLPNSILISEHTQQSAVNSLLDLREIGVYASAGMTSSIKIYELLDRKERQSPRYEQH